MRKPATMTSANTRYRLNRLLAVATIISVLQGCSRSDPPAPSWVENVFPSAGNFAGRCDTLRQNFYLRSIFNRYYYWTEDIIDQDPADFASTSQHFDYLVTNDITASGKAKDAYSAFISSEEYNNLVSGDGERGYGMRLTSSEPDFTGAIRIAYVAPNSPAALANIVRGDEITEVDGFTLIGADREISLPLLFPRNTGESHDFSIAGKGVITLVSEDVDFEPVQHEQIIGTDTGYLFFDDHAQDAEGELISAMQMFANHNGGTGIDELILDLRYNSGGLLFIANQLSYMIAGGSKTSGKFFERLKFNDNFSDENLIFQSIGRDPVSGLNTTLPQLSLARVIVISDHATCSASESIINALRGVGVEVVLIGEQTCGKPYGFIGFRNCGNTWLPIEFQSFNHLNESGYQDGFRADAGSFGVTLPGCVVADDFSTALGVSSEGRIAAALEYIDSENCPVAALISSSALRSAPALRAPGLAVNSAAMMKALQGWSVLEERDMRN